MKGAQFSIRKCNVCRERINVSKLLDMGSVAPKITWRGPITVGVKELMRSLIEHYEMELGEWSFHKFSYHHPILIILKYIKYGETPKQFKFESDRML